MTPDRARLVRRGLLLAVVGVTGVVAATLRRPSEEPTRPPAPPASGTPGTRTRQLEWQGFKGEREVWVLRAQDMAGPEQEEQHLVGVELTFEHTTKGRISRSTITSDQATFVRAQQKCQFQGHVVLRSKDDDLELTTEFLIYRGDKAIAKTDLPVAFRRKDVSGSATGLHYQAEGGVLELPADVVVRVQDEDAPPMEIRSARAILERESGTLQFEGGVRATQEEDVLTSGRLTLNLSEDSRTIYRALAVDDVDLRTASGRAFPGVRGAAGGGGPRHLTCRKLDVWVRANRALQEVTAGPDADLTLLPSPGEPPERRRIKARFLIFRFDEEGRLYEVQGQKDSFFAAEPLPPAKGTPRTVSAENVLARLDPVTGESQVFDFVKDVVFTRGGQKATAENGWYDGPKSLLILKGSPRVVDEEQGTELTAVAIDLGTETGDVAARHNVRQVVKARRGARGGLLGSPESPTLISCRFLDYQAGTKTGRYRDDALLRSGADEVRAGEIQVAERADGRRRLTASRDVSSLFEPKAEPGQKVAERVAARAQEMVYDESTAEVVYAGDVVLRRGDLLTRSPKATLSLTADGRDLRKLVAGEPVELRQGERVLTGRRATYTPADETVVLVGDQAVLKAPDQEVRGRSLTLKLRDDTILVDGQALGRTETIIRNRRPESPVKP
jgi:LPS export ABC transporter protein LptC/lipopolysaccharide transport protein LptA